MRDLKKNSQKNNSHVSKKKKKKKKKHFQYSLSSSVQIRQKNITTVSNVCYLNIKLSAAAILSLPFGPFTATCLVFVGTQPRNEPAVRYTVPDLTYGCKGRAI